MSVSHVDRYSTVFETGLSHCDIVAVCMSYIIVYDSLQEIINDMFIASFLICSNKLKPRFARFQLECPMPIALHAPSREYISRFALRLGFVLVVDWNV